MKLSRIRDVWWIGAAAVYGVTILDIVNTYPQLSTLKSYVSTSKNLTAFIQNANNVTFLAPSNEAIGNFTKLNGNMTADAMHALVQYSLLQGGYPTLSFKKIPQFVASNLYNATYTNVTGGQRVELVLASDGTLEAITGNQSISTFSSTNILCNGGIVHIVNDILSIPIPGLQEVILAPFEYFASIVSIGGYLSTAKSEYVDQTLTVSDVTYFLPNTAEALANFQALTQNTSDVDKQALFLYHIVPGFVGYSSDLTNGLSLKTMQGNNLTITVQNGDTYVNSAKIISTDWMIGNGVVQVLDDFLNYLNTSGPVAPSLTVASFTSTSTPTPTPTPTVAAPSPTHSTKGGLATGAEIGIGVGAGVVGLVLLAALVWFRRRRQEKQEWNMAGVPADMERFYLKRGMIQKQEDLNLGLQSAGMQDTEGTESRDVNSGRHHSLEDSRQSTP